MVIMFLFFSSFFSSFFFWGGGGGRGEGGMVETCAISKRTQKVVIIASYLYLRSLQAYRTLKKMGTLQKTALPWIFSTQKRW